MSLSFLRFAIDSHANTEIVYDMSRDRIGDAIGAVCILEHIAKARPNIKISVLYYARDNEEYSWINGINLFHWTEWQPHMVYQSAPPGKFVFHSSDSGSLNIWRTLHDLKLQPKLQIPSNVQVSYSDPEPVVSIHIINAVGVRNKPYVSRRTLNMEKYENIGRNLAKHGIAVSRLGASYDRIRDLDLCVNDLTSKNLTLHDTFAHLANSDLFMGGDSGLTHAAAALNVPIVAEVDPISKAALGLAGIPSHLLTEIPYNCSFDAHQGILNEHPLLKDKLRQPTI